MGSILLDTLPTLQVNREELSEIVERLVKVYDPLRIYLFGSYVWGTPHRDSDYDICVVVEKSEEKPRHRSRKGYQSLIGKKGRTPVDLIIYTNKNFEVAATHSSTMASIINEKGVLLYA